MQGKLNGFRTIFVLLVLHLSCFNKNRKGLIVHVRTCDRGERMYHVGTRVIPAVVFFLEDFNSYINKAKHLM